METDDVAEVVEDPAPSPSLMAKAIKPNGIYKAKRYLRKGPTLITPLGRVELPVGSISQRLKQLACSVSPAPK